jgi:YjbE family integral membrane protein
VAPTAEVLSQVLQIVVIDLVLSGDNAVVIGIAAHPLPRRQRRMAILLGGGGAILLRIVLTGAAALLLGLPAVKAVGGVVLLWIAFKLLEVEEEAQAGARSAMTLRGAVVTILVADFVMSLDNVLGVAAASDGNLVLLMLGLIVSMAIVMFGGSIVAELLDHLWWLAYAGAAIIAWIGADMVQDDALVAQAGQLPDLGRYAVNALVTLIVVALAHRVHRHSSSPSRRSAG